MTLPRYAAICDHWRHTPPVAVTAAILARYYGAMKPAEKKRVAASENTDARRAELIEMLGGAQGFSKEKPAWLTKT